MDGDKIMNFIMGVGQTVGSFFMDHKKAILTGLIHLSICIVIFVCGWMACKHFDANVVEVPVTKVEVREVKIPVATEQQSVVQYVEKASPADADVEIHNSKPTVEVNYNGQRTSFETLSNEKQKFDKGKLNVESETKTVLDVTPIVTREVQAAVDTNTKELTKQKDEAVKQEKKKAKRHGIESFLAGAAVGALAVVF